MLKKLLSFCFRTLAAIPFLEVAYRIFYARALKVLKRSLHDIEGIEDIYLTSDIKSKDFVFGVSDYNLFIIIDNETHPKKVLREIRKRIHMYKLTALIVNTTFIPILSLDEFKVTPFKSYLIRNSIKEKIIWRSILVKDRKLEIKPSQSGSYPLIYSALQDIDSGIFLENTQKARRTHVKNIARSLKTLEKHYPNQFKFSKKYYQRARHYLRYPTLLSFSYPAFLRKTWQELSQLKQTPPSRIKENHLSISKHLKEHLKSLLEFSFIDDITLTPSLIQLKQKEVTGKVFIEIHLNHLFYKKHFFSQRENLIAGIHNFESSDLKIRARFINSVIHSFQLEMMAYPFPLEPLYRKKKCYSFEQKDYWRELTYKKTTEASVNFFMIQFMRFRSSKQKTDLIGSKFIKSFNLMYRFYLLAEFLDKKEIHFTDNINEIKQVLSPQFRDIDPLREVENEDWKLIRAQLIHFLKRMRKRLARYDKNLLSLKF